MYKKKKDKKKNTIRIIIISVVLLILLSVSLLVQHDNTFIKDGVMLIEKTLMYPFTSLNKEKEQTQTESYTIQKNINSSLEKEIEELKKQLELNKTLTEYDVVNATVLSRNKSYWFNTMTIDKGKKAGIKKNMAVITKDGLIGKISKVSNYSSEIKLITSNDTNFKVSVSIKTNDEDNYAILNGYDKKTGLIKLSGIDKTTNINIDDSVLTGGLGEMLPSVIYVGQVKKIENDKYNLSKIVYIQTGQDFNNIHYVTVLNVK